MAELDKATLNSKLQEGYASLEEAYNRVADPDLQLPGADIPIVKELIRKTLACELTTEERDFIAGNQFVLNQLCKIWGFLHWTSGNLEVYSREYEAFGYSFDTDPIGGYGRNDIYVRLPLLEAYEASQEVLRVLQEGARMESTIGMEAQGLNRQDLINILKEACNKIQIVRLGDEYEGVIQTLERAKAGAISISSELSEPQRDHLLFIDAAERILVNASRYGTGQA